MKAVLASIHPQHCEQIAAGEKTFEVRKSIPKLKPPFTCYIYQTKRSWAYKLLEKLDMLPLAEILCRNQQRVVGQFVCDRTTQYVWIPDQYPWSQKSDGDYYLTDYDLNSTCLTAEEIKAYGKGDALYGWHISDLEIYDKPIPITSFFLACNKPIWRDCTLCKEAGKFHCKQLERPPQSWCYVMEQ